MNDCLMFGRCLYTHTHRSLPKNRCSHSRAYHCRVDATQPRNDSSPQDLFQGCVDKRSRKLFPVGSSTSGMARQAPCSARALLYLQEVAAVD